jgi:hypothetical protein
MNEYGALMECFLTGEQWNNSRRTCCSVTVYTKFPEIIHVATISEIFKFFQILLII